MNKKLLEGEQGERANIKAALEWILTEMDYKDFRKLTRLRFYDANGGYPFTYSYMVDEKDDSARGREDYIKYYLYKLIQNLATPNVSLRDVL